MTFLFLIPFIYCLIVDFLTWQKLLWTRSIFFFVYFGHFSHRIIFCILVGIKFFFIFQSDDSDHHLIDVWEKELFHFNFTCFFSRRKKSTKIHHQLMTLLMLMMMMKMQNIYPKQTNIIDIIKLIIIFIHRCRRRRLFEFLIFVCLFVCRNQFSFVLSFFIFYFYNADYGD